MDRLDRWTAPIFILFFVLSGAELDLSVFTNVMIVVVGLVYIIVRCVGKYFGASLSSKLAKAPSNVKKYLGITLFPQAGVALGMAIKVTEYCATTGNASAMQIGVVVQNIILFSVLIYELIGPFLTKIALSKAGEINPEGKSSARQKDTPKQEISK
jgi:NhaP-type Na+/H+ or K+/H+ antiporter